MSDLITTAKGTLVRQTAGVDYIRTPDPEFPVKVLYWRQEPSMAGRVPGVLWLRSDAKLEVVKDLFEYWERTSPVNRKYSIGSMILP